MSGSSQLSVGRAVDWQFAGTVGAKLARPAPPATDYTRRQAIDELATAARAAERPVREVTRLGNDEAVSDARIIDREQWIRAASESMRVMTGGTDRPSNPITGRITGAQTGAVLAFVSSGILGQFDPFAVDGQGGQLLLVYPNVIAVERQLRVSPSDFRLWVCLHEVTHRVQFTAVPWLRQHMLDEITALADSLDTDPDAMRDRLSHAAGELVKLVRGQGDGQSLIDVLATPEQRVILDRVTAFMSLVEGHAEYVMNAVEPGVIPSQPAIEARFAARRRKGGNPLDRLLRRLLGMEAKTRQYVDGAAFVRAVVDRVGVEDFNAIWTSAETLPSKDEIADPARWIARIHA